MHGLHQEGGAADTPEYGGRSEACIHEQGGDGDVRDSIRHTQEMEGYGAAGVFTGRERIPLLERRHRQVSQEQPLRHLRQ